MLFGDEKQHIRLFSQLGGDLPRPQVLKFRKRPFAGLHIDIGREIVREKLCEADCLRMSALTAVKGQH